MKKLIVTLFLLLSATIVQADDTEIYGASSISVTPNVLILFDNSGSMGNVDVPTDLYDANTDYSSHGNKTRNAVYRLKDGNWNKYFSDDFTTDSKWQCPTAKTELDDVGYYKGDLDKSGKNPNKIVTCGTGSAKDYRTGNYLNFQNKPASAYRSRMEVAKEVIAKLIYDNQGEVRFGIMKFHTQQGGKVVSYLSDTDASVTNLIGDFEPGDEMHDWVQSGLGEVGKMDSTTWTPLAETLAEAGLYYSGKSSWFNGSLNYSSVLPIQYRCQKNYVIIMTDGEPTKDDTSHFSNTDYILTGKRISSLPADPNSSSSYLDNIAKFLRSNDLLPLPDSPTDDQKMICGTPGDFEYQTITTYTIGFQSNQTLLANTATNGSGEYYVANNVSTLNEAFNNIISTIKASNESFIAASVPVSKANQAYAGNFVYYGLFQPEAANQWKGNIKKYGLSNSGKILDKNGDSAVSGGAVTDTATSYWSDNGDGPNVQAGGVGDVLLDKIENSTWTRKLYTYLDTSSTTIKSTANEFVNTNLSLTDGTYSDLTGDVISLVRRENGSWPLDSFLHSQPLVVHYDTDSDGTLDDTVIFGGSNGGMLHAFNDYDGEELWGFIPPDLLGSLHKLKDTTDQVIMVDGAVQLSEKVDNSINKKMLIFGERRGGYSYNAIDVSNYNEPYYLYSITRDFLGTGKEPLGQSWGEAKKILLAQTTGTDPIEAFLLPGGYDVNQDVTDSSQIADTSGRAIFAINRWTGSIVNNFKFFPDATATSDYYFPFTDSIIAVDGFENPKSRNTTRIYAGDLGGTMWAFRDDVYHHNLKHDTSIVTAMGGVDGQEDGKFDQKIVLLNEDGQKIFYEPNITNEYYNVPIEQETAGTYKNQKRVGDFVFYGTGDRANPNRKDIVNSFYAIKNKWAWEILADETRTSVLTAPEFVKAYIDMTTGAIRNKKTNAIIVDPQRDSEGMFINDITAKSYFILDNSLNIIQSGDVTNKIRFVKYVVDALNHPQNAGWHIDFKDKNGTAIGEKVVSTPTIYKGVVYFTAYVPKQDVAQAVDEDKCSGTAAEGEGRLYMIDYRTGAAVVDADRTTVGIQGHTDRYIVLSGKGIPPEQVLVVHKDKESIVVGFQEVPVSRPSRIENYYWRQLENN